MYNSKTDNLVKILNIINLKAHFTFCKPFSFSRKRRETNNKSVAKNRARKKEEKEAKERRMEELRFDF